MPGLPAPSIPAHRHTSMPVTPGPALVFPPVRDFLSISTASAVRLGDRPNQALSAPRLEKGLDSSSVRRKNSCFWLLLCNPSFDVPRFLLDVNRSES